MADQIAQGLNRLSRNGCDFLSSEDCSALMEFMGEYLEEEEQELPDNDEEYTDINDGIVNECNNNNKQRKYY